VIKEFDERGPQAILVQTVHNSSFYVGCSSSGAKQFWSENHRSCVADFQLPASHNSQGVPLGIYDKGINVSDWNCGCNERWFALWSRLGGYNGVIFSPRSPHHKMKKFNMIQT
jgi:hypothetical protein